MHYYSFFSTAAVVTAHADHPVLLSVTSIASVNLIISHIIEGFSQIMTCARKVDSSLYHSPLNEAWLSFLGKFEQVMLKLCRLNATIFFSSCLFKTALTTGNQ